MNVILNVIVAMKALKMNNVTEFLDKEAKRRSKSSESEQSKSFDDNIIYPSSLPPVWSLDISSDHTLQLTLTKTCLEILMELQKVRTLCSMVTTTLLCCYSLI